MKNKAGFIMLAMVLIFLTGLVRAREGEAMEIKSPEFKNGQFIPTQFSGEGEDVNPELIIENIPNGVKSLALIVDDPDAPSGTWVHWVVFDIPLVSKINQNSVPGKLGINSAGQRIYQGPYPPSGVHRYFFKLYALDTTLNLPEGINKEQLEKAAQGHVLAQAQLLGLYKKIK